MLGKRWGVAVPWAVASVATVFAVGARIAPTHPQKSTSSQTQATDAVERAQARAVADENQALRRELDRLRSNASSRIDPESYANSAPSEQLASAEVADRQSDVPESENCDQIAAEAASETALAQSEAQSESVTEGEAEVADYRANVVALIAERLQDQPDPDLQGQLLVAASTLATPDTAPLLAASFVNALQSDSVPEARSAAARGLRFASGREVDDALAAATYHQDEETRLAAIESLASHPESRGLAEDLLRSEGSERIRFAVECRLQISPSAPS